MPTSSAEPAKAARYLFGPFRLRPGSGVLYRGDELVSLAPKTFDVLLLLVENAGEVVSKQEILDKVWADSFVEESSLTKNISILRKILDEGLPGVEAIRTISKRGYQFTVEVVPEYHQPVQEPVVAPPSSPIQPTAPPVAVSLPPPVRSHALRWPRWSFAVAALLLASAGIWTVRARILPRPPRSAVAVISFHDLSGKPENAWLSRAISEMLTTELETDSKLRTLPGDVTARLRADLGLPDQSGFFDETLARIRRAVDCDYVVSGSYLSIDGQVRLDVRIQDTEKPTSAAALVFSGTEKQLPDLAAKAGAGIRARFGGGRISPDEEAKDGVALGAVQPSDPTVRKIYFQALEKLGSFDPAGAKPLLESVVAQDAGFALGHLELATALLQTGYERRASEETRKAMELSGHLPTSERLAVEARYRETIGQWPRASEIYASLWTFHPDNPEFGFSLARVQIRAGTGDLAGKTLLKLRASASAEVAARVGLAEAELAMARGEYGKASSGFASVVLQARALGSRLLEGRAHASQALASEKTGDSVKSRVAWQEAVRLCTEVGDSGCVANALNNESVILLDSDELPAALEAVNRALQLARKSGSRGQEGRALNILGLVLRRQGDLAGARENFDACLAIAREIGDPKLVAIALRRLGDVFTRTGDSEAALRNYTELMELSRKSDNKIDLAAALDSIGRLEQRKGDLPAARRDLEEALGIQRATHAETAVASTLAILANLSKNMGDLENARGLRAEECKMQRTLGRKDPLLRCSLALADIDLLQGRFREAAVAAQSLAEASQGSKQIPEAYRILALAKLALGDTTAAAKAIQTARTTGVKAGAKDEDLLTSTPLTIAAGRIESAMGHKREAAILFQRAQSQAVKTDTVSLMLEVRLAMAEAVARDNGGSAGRQLKELVTESTAKGYLGVAARAQKLLSTSVR